MSTDPAFWDRLAVSYAARPVADPAAFDRKIEVMKAHLGPGAVVVDVGCGTGSLALRLAPFAREVHGVDYSSEMIRIARGKLVDAPHTGVQFHLGPADTGELPFPAASADLVSACSLLHLVPDRDAVLTRLFRLVKPGGHVVTSTVCLGDTWVPYGPILAVLRWVGKAPPVTLLTRARLAEDLRRAGFVDVVAPEVGAKPEVAFLVARRPADPPAG